MTIVLVFAMVILVYIALVAIRLKRTSATWNIWKMYLRGVASFAVAYGLLAKAEPQSRNGYVLLTLIFIVLMFLGISSMMKTRS